MRPPRVRTLDRSVNSVAYSVFPMNAPEEEGGPPSGDFVHTPWAAGNEEQLVELRQHYYAAVSFSDYAAGRVLSSLDEEGLENATLVVAHSDHGWHLGEYGMWEKRSNWELATRVPLVIRAPWLHTGGVHSRALVELVDIYPTIADALGVALPNDSVPIDGTSLVPVLCAPERAAGKAQALSLFPRCKHPKMPIYGGRSTPGGADNSCLDVEAAQFTWMGYSMRTARWRYTEWVAWNGTRLAPVWSQRLGTELYDHSEGTGAWTDPDRFENVNLAATAEPKLLAELSARLREAYRQN